MLSGVTYRLEMHCSSFFFWPILGSVIFKRLKTLFYPIVSFCSLSTGAKKIWFSFVFTAASFITHSHS